MTLRLRFLEAMQPDPKTGRDGTLVFELAPVALLPHTVFIFLELARSRAGGSFHRAAPHVLQAQPTTTRN